MAAGLELLFNSINSLLLPRLIVWKSISLELLWVRQYQLFWIYFGIGIFPVFTLTVAANPIYHKLLGEEFIEGCLIFQVLIWGRFVVFLGQIYAWGLAAASQDKQFLIASVGGTIFSLILNITLVPIYGLISAALTSFFSELVVVSFCYLFFKQYIVKAKQV
jgi:O-antigen/teichoic acid export membrane protein